MKIAVFGLGYIGCVCTACLARDDHYVIGVDINPGKVNSIQEGKSPIAEPGLEPLIQAGIAAGKIAVTCDVVYAIENAEVAMICVGTPSKDNGDLELNYVERVCADIGSAMIGKNTYMVVVVRSTILPGVAEKKLIPILESESGKKAGEDFGFCVNPEFLREGSAIADFDCPPYTVIGQSDERSGERITQLYSGINAPLYRVPIDIAAMIKYTSNAFHALKVEFANEIGNVCQMYGIDSHRVMDIFVQDTKLNISPAYLKPGFAFGGSCLGKDLRALLHIGRQFDVQLPVLESILPGNQLQIQKVVEMLIQEGKRKVGIIGLSFKPNTDDLRESPAIQLVDRLLNKGFELYIYDSEISLSQLQGSNHTQIDQTVPHMSSFMRTSLEEAVEMAEAVVVTKYLSSDEQDGLVGLLRPDQILMDLVRLDGQKLQKSAGRYRGICW